MEFVIIGSLQKSRKEIERTIKKLGGKLVDRVHYKLTAVISNAKEVQKMENQMQEAKAYEIQVVSVEFLTEVARNIDPILYILSKSLCDWGGDVCFQFCMDGKPRHLDVKIFINYTFSFQPFTRIEKSNDATRAKTYYTKSVPKVVTYQWKGDYLMTIFNFFNRNSLTWFNLNGT